MRASFIIARISAAAGMLLIPLCCALQAQLHTIAVKGKMGLVSEAGELLLAPEFDSIRIKDNGWYYVYKEGRTGLFSGYGGMIVKPEFDMVTTVSRFSSLFMGKGKDMMIYSTDGPNFIKLEADSIRYMGGAYHVFSGGLAGVCDFEARMLIAPQHESIMTVYNGYLGRNGREWKRYSLGGECKASFTADEITFTSFMGLGYVARDHNQWGLIDTSGKSLIPFRFDSVIVINAQYVLVLKGGLKGLMNTRGRLVLEPVYNSIQLLDYGFLIACDTTQCTLFATDGSRISKPGDWAQVQPLSTRYVQVQNAQGQYGVIDSTGRIAVKAVSSYPIVLNNGRLMAGTKSGELILLNDMGQPCTTFGMDALGVYKYGIAEFWKNGKKGLLDEKGKVVANAVYDEIERMSTVVRLRKGSIWETMYFTEEGKVSDAPQILLDRDRWESTRAFSGQGNTRGGGGGGGGRSSRGWYQNNSGFWGLGDSVTGRVIIEPQFTYVNFRRYGRFCEVTKGLNESPRYGLVDMKNRRIAQPAEFRLIRTNEFIHGNVAGAQTANGNWVLIDARGKVIPGKNLTYIGDFNHGFAPVCEGGSMAKKTSIGIETLFEKRTWVQSAVWTNSVYYEVEKGKWGVMDSLGHWVIKPTYDFIGTFRNGVAVYRKGEAYGLLNMQGQPITPPLYADISFLKHKGEMLAVMKQKGNREGLVTETGDWQVPPLYEEMKNLAEGIVPVKQGKDWFYIDTLGVRISDSTFADAFPFSDGWGRVKMNGGYTWVSRSGNVLGAARYVRAGDFHEGKAWYQEKGVFHYLRTDGSSFGNFTFTGDFRNGVAFAKDDKGLGLIDENGQYLMRQRVKTLRWVSDTVIAATSDSKTGVLSTTGEWILHPRYSALLGVTQGYYIVKKENMVFLLDGKGRKVFRQEYLDFRPYAEGLAAVRTSKGWGYIDLQGNEVIAPQYAKAESFCNGYAAVQIAGSKWIFIRPDGTELKTVRNFAAGAFSEGFAPVLRAYSEYKPPAWTFTDTTGKSLCKPAFLAVAPFHNGCAWVQTKEGWRLMGSNGNFLSDVTLGVKPVFTHGISTGRTVAFSGLYTLKGEEIVAPVYESFESDGGLIKVTSGGSWGYVKRDGSWVWKIK